MKSINIYFLLSILLLNLIGCDNKKENNEISFLNNTVIQATDVIIKNSAASYNQLENELNKQFKNENLALYNQIAILEKEEATAICSYIDSIKNIESIGWIKIINKLETFKNSTKERGKIIFENDSIYIHSLDSILTFMPEKEFKSLSKDLQMSVLNRMVFGIRNLENDFIKICIYKTTPICGLNMSKMSFLIGQSATHVRTGDLLTITAGVGEFSAATKPIISIGDNNIEVNGGQGIRVMKVKEKVGINKIPIKIEYTDENGKKNTKTEIIEYTIEE
jgi:hypothetical protein